MSNQYHKLLNCIKEDTKEERHDFLYRIDERGVVIEGYIGRKKYLVVPENIEGHPVYKIDDNAFYEDEKMKKITLPNTLRIIGKEAFACSSLETVILSGALLIIDDGAFANSSLKSADIPDSVSVIGEDAFSGTEITSITIPRWVISIGARAFEYTNISSIKIPSSVKSVSEEMFSWCKELHSVIIEGAETIEEGAFYGCEKLKNISLPDTLTSIEDKAFSGTGIEYLIIPQSVNYVGEDNFPDHAHIAILSDETEFYLGDSDYSDYSQVTLYCNQSNTNTRKTAKEYHMKQKSLATFAKISADYYKTFAPETAIEITAPKVFCETNYCETKCEFYAACQANKETCVKNTYEQVLQTLTCREERVIRLIYGIGEHKESVQLVARVFGITEEQVKQVWGKALKKMRHPTRARPLRSTDIGTVLLSANETTYFNLWCAILL